MWLPGYEPGAIYRTRLPPEAIGILAYDQCSGAALPRRRPEGDSIAIRKLSGRSQGGSLAIL